jgi:hypothetical protein
MGEETRRQPDIPELDSIPPPTGTLFVLLVYLAILVGMWGTMYYYLLGK